MIALFNSQSYATRAANAIHAYLQANRPGYNAASWAVTNKSNAEEKWAVKIPPDYPAELILGEAAFVETLPDNWFPEATIGT